MNNKFEYDLEKVKEIAREVGVEVNPPELQGQHGLFVRNIEGEIEKWDVLSEFRMSTKSSHT